MKRVYLDHAASTPIDPKAERVIAASLKNEFGNPSSLHRDGQKASAAIFRSRRIVAESIGASYDEIIFTGSATEANNLALRGAVSGWKTLHPKPYTRNPRIVVSAIEHESILETAEDLKRDGAEVVIIPVSKKGIIDLKKLTSAINDRTIIVSVMHANNEIGTIQPIEKIAEIIKLKRKNRLYPLFHNDAAQSFQYLDCNVSRCGVDLMTISSQKIYGPKGIGALYIRKSIQDRNLIQPTVTGGGQERGLRSGTENIALIVGFGEAVLINEALKIKEAKRIGTLRDYTFRELKKIIPKIKLNGDAKHRLPNNLNLSIPGEDAHELMIALDLRGIAVSTGSACASRTSTPSTTLLALGLSKTQAAASLRMTLGRGTTKKEIDQFVKMIKIVLQSK